MKSSLLCCLLVITGACNEGLRTAAPGAIGRAAPELRTFGSATIAVQESDEDHGATQTTSRVAMGDQVEVSLADRAYDPDHPGDGPSLQASTFQLPIRDLLADCPAGEIVNDEATRRSHPNCKLLRSSTTIVVGHPLVPDRTELLVLGALGATGGLTACALECRSPWSTVSGVTLISSVAVAAVVGVGTYVWLMTKIH